MAFLYFHSKKKVPPCPTVQEFIIMVVLSNMQVLGAGQFGTVWLALQRLRDNSGLSVHRAVKILRPNASEQDQEDFLREALTMTQLEHAHLVRN